MMPIILEHIDGQRQAIKMTRSEMAQAMEKESGEEWDKEKLDKIFNSDSCPRAETLFLMLKVVGLAAYPWKWCRPKRKDNDD